MRISLNGKEKDIKSTDVMSLLKELKINPETVVVSRNRGIVTEFNEIKEGDSIQLIKVTSGG